VTLSVTRPDASTRNPAKETPTTYQNSRVAQTKPETTAARTPSSAFFCGATVESPKRRLPFTMGRTPIVRRKPTTPQDGTHVTDEDSSPTKEAYPRRFPRLGSQFQTRLPRSNDPLDRPLPKLISREHPHLSDQVDLMDPSSSIGRFSIVVCSSEMTETNTVM